MKLRTRTLTVALSLSSLLFFVATDVPPAAAAPAWAPAASAAIHPGVQTFTNGAQCTANFVFYDGTAVYIGQAAHCSGTGGKHRDEWVHVRVLVDRNTGAGHRRFAARDHGLQLVADHAGAR